MQLVVLNMKAILNSIKVSFLLFAIKYVNCDSCVTYNFEDSFYELFTFSETCTRLAAEREWTLDNYYSTPVVHPFSANTSFISPGTISSCTSSFPFLVSNGGLFEINIFMDAEEMQAHIQVFLNKIEEGPDSVVGVLSLHPGMSTYQRGWNTLRSIIITDKVYEGYATFVASSAEESKLLVDSFRYIPSDYVIDDCVIYLQETEPEEANSNEPDERPDACVTYNFEKSFNDLFSESRWCTNMPAEGEWTLGKYSLTLIELPHPASTSYVSPGTIMSCTSSFIFLMSNGGTFEVNVYMDADEPSNQLLVFVNELIEGGDDTQAATMQLNPILPTYQKGWNTLTATLGGTGTYEGYVTLMAVATEGSKLLVDSFRYIPTSYEIDDCEIYPLLTEPDETDPEENTTEENTSNETSENYPNVTEENSSNQTEEDNTDDSEETDSHTCVTYNFEEGFDEKFSYSRMCTTTPAQGDWTLGNYSLASIELPHPASTSYVSPSTIMSCTSSFTFLMSNGGTFEVNVYMDADEFFNQLLIFVNELVEGGDDTQVATITLNPNLDTYQKGWNTLTATLGSTGTYVGYVTLMGAASEESILLVDSFRYIPPEYNIETCVIYPQEEQSGETTTESTVSTEGEPNVTEENNSNQTEEEVTGETEVTSAPGGNETTETDKATEETTEGDNSNVTEGNNSNQTEEEETSETEVTSAPGGNKTTETDKTTEETTEGNNSNVTEENNSNQTDEEYTSETEVTSAPDENETTEIDQTTEETTDGNNSNVTEENNSNQTDAENTTESEYTREPEENETNETDEDNSNEYNSTELPDTRPVKGSNFWNPLTITMVVLISLITLALVSLCFYEYGKTSAQNRRPLVYDYNDVEVPPEMRVPRVDKAYPEAKVMAY